MKSEKLSLNDHAIDALKESGKWCMFLAVVGFIFIGLMVIAGAVMTVAMQSIPEGAYGGAMEPHPFGAFKAYFGIIYIIFAIIYFFPVYYLYNYAKGIKQASESGNEEVLATALVNLKSHHKFLGVMTIIIIIMYILAFVVGIIFAAKYGAGM